MFRSCDQLGHSIVYTKESLFNQEVDDQHNSLFNLCVRPGLPWRCRKPVWAVTMFATQKIPATYCLIKPSRIIKPWWQPITMSSPRLDCPIDFQHNSWAEAWYLPQDVKEFGGHSLIAYFQKCTFPSVTFRGAKGLVRANKTWRWFVDLSGWAAGEDESESSSTTAMVESPLGTANTISTHCRCLFWSCPVYHSMCIYS